jgi:hypothetical protein
MMMAALVLSASSTTPTSCHRFSVIACAAAAVPEVTSVPQAQSETQIDLSVRFNVISQSRLCLKVQMVISKRFEWTCFKLYMNYEREPQASLM